MDFEKKKEKCIMIESFAAHLFWYSIYIYIYISGTELELIVRGAALLLVVCSDLAFDFAAAYFQNPKQLIEITFI